MQSSGLMTLRHVVMDYKNRHQDYSMDDYKRLLQMVINCVTNLNIFFVDSFEVAYLKTDGNGVINLPSDYIDYTKVAINICGKYWTLTLKEDLIPPQGYTCGIPIDKISAGCCERFPDQYPYPDNGYFFAGHWWNGDYRATFYSIGGGFNRNYFRVDKTNRQIIIDGCPLHEIVLEYRSSGVKINETTYIPRQYLESIIAWVEWQDAKRGINGMNPDRAYADYISEEALLVNLEQRRTGTEYADTFYTNWKQGPKR